MAKKPSDDELQAVRAEFDRTGVVSLDFMRRTLGWRDSDIADAIIDEVFPPQLHEGLRSMVQPESLFLRQLHRLEIALTGGPKP